MAVPFRQGNSVVNPRNGATVRWKPIEPVADEYDAAKKLGWPILGVIGNASHLAKTGGHTPWCAELGAKPGWVYAIDIGVPEALGVAFEAWLLGKLRAGYYPWVGYWNLLNHHWSRAATKTSGGKTVQFATSVYSGDHHLHLSGRGGYETTNSSILLDFKNRNAAKPPTKPTVTEDDMDPADKERAGNIEVMLGALRDRREEITLLSGGKPVKFEMGIVRDLNAIGWAPGIRPGQTPEQVRDQQESAAVAGLRADVAAISAKLDRFLGPATGA